MSPGMNSGVSKTLVLVNLFKNVVTLNPAFSGKPVTIYKIWSFIFRGCLVY